MCTNYRFHNKAGTNSSEETNMLVCKIQLLFCYIFFTPYPNCKNANIKYNSLSNLFTYLHCIVFIFCLPELKMSSSVNLNRMFPLLGNISCNFHIMVAAHLKKQMRAFNYGFQRHSKIMQV